ncbi:MAG: primosomal protein N' [Syntrophobacterales bacterium]|nr:primosomal protein N' [Syntrophobacterales bacterium]
MFLNVQLLDPTGAILTYRFDGAERDNLRGCRVIVPVGRQQRLGIVLEVTPQEPPISNIKTVTALLDSEPIFSEELLVFYQRVASYYLYPLGLTLLRALPDPLRNKPSGKEVLKRSKKIGILLVPPDSIQDRAFDDRVRELFISNPLGVPVAKLREMLKKDWHRFISRAKRRKWLEIISIPEESVIESPFGQAMEVSAPIQLTDDQAKILNEAEDALDQGKFLPYLLYGVTGSGKTEIYLRLTERTLEMGRSVMVLAPEIALITQLETIFRKRFGEKLALWHSGLTSQVRISQWEAIIRGQKRIVLGTRSAIFLPIKDCGLIIVDEEHDPSYKQEDRMRYNARDVALMRAQVFQIPIILGSATPSLQSYYQARKKQYGLFTITQRVHGHPLPEVEVVDMRKERYPKIFSQRLKEVLQETFYSGFQSLLFINRRGYAPYVLCRRCGYVVICNRCNIALTYHIDENNLRCHYCGFSMDSLKICPGCGKSVLLYLGVGTEKVEEEVKKLLPQAKIARIDRDAIKNMNTLVTTLNFIRQGKVNVIIGTQMITKGHDFPLLTLTGVINADIALALPDFRSGELTAQQLLQVAGRSGRKETIGRVIIQTYNPSHYIIEASQKGDYSLFCERELESRERLFYPPYSKMARIICESTDMERVHEGAQKLSDLLKSLAERYGCIVLGPAPTPFFKLRNRYRWHILIKSWQSGTLTELLKTTFKSIEKLRRRIHIAIDRDPLTCL